MQCDIWGPRKGKSSSRAIPTVLAAPGAAFATSNKPDLYAATRGLRERQGRVWNFDPEQLAAGEPDWWWNPLTYVTSDRRALELTDAFVGAYRDPDARPDPFFDPAGQELVSHLLRAAALAERPITQAFLWSTRPNDDEPARILEHHGLELAAASVLDHVHAPFEQRGGVFGTARQILSFLRDPDITRWVTGNGPADRRPQLDLAAFVHLERHAVPAQQGRPGFECRVGDGAGDGVVRCGRAARETLPRRPAGGARWSAYSTKRRTSAAGGSSPTSTATTARVGSRC